MRKIDASCMPNRKTTAQAEGGRRQVEAVRPGGVAARRLSLMMMIMPTAMALSCARRYLNVKIENRKQIEGNYKSKVHCTSYDWVCATSRCPL